MKLSKQAFAGCSNIQTYKLFGKNVCASAMPLLNSRSMLLSLDGMLCSSALFMMGDNGCACAG